MMPKLVDYFTIVYWDTSGKVVVKSKPISDALRMIENAYYGVAVSPDPVITELDQANVDFCIGKCGEGYCNYMSTRRQKGDFPCLEYICAVCKIRDKPHSCEFCKGISS